jgi:hypothetical protein
VVAHSQNFFPPANIWRSNDKFSKPSAGITSPGIHSLVEKEGHLLRTFEFTEFQVKANIVKG